MKIQATKSFVGKIRAVKGQIIEVSAKDGRSLIKAGYAREVKGQKKSE